LHWPLSSPLLSLSAQMPGLAPPDSARRLPDCRGAGVLLFSGAGGGYALRAAPRRESTDGHSATAAWAELCARSGPGANPSVRVPVSAAAVGATVLEPLHAGGWAQPDRRMDEADALAAPVNEAVARQWILSASE